MNKKLLLFIVACLVSAFVLAACGGSEEESTDATESDSGTDLEETESEGGVIEVEHAMGTTTLEEKPERVVSLYQGATDTVLEFDVTPVGVVESWVQMPMYDYIKEDLQDVTYVGQETQPNLEEIAALDPDVIFASQIRHEEIYEQLNEIAPTIVNETIYDFKETTNLIGQALGEEEKAETLLADWDSRIADFQEKIASDENWPMSAAVLNYRADHARIYVTGFAGSILQEAGFEEPIELQGQNEEIVMLNDKEAIPQMNADVFFQFMEDTPDVQNTFEDWTAHPLYQNLEAVQNDNVFTVDEVAWNMAGGLQAANLMLDDMYEYFELEQ
ncbi:ABC transporter substrate-binding protein [Jeotgalibacillus haloalkalitolerans]|uniref:Iron-siderophore ABC transporter substrate-binding protein n=1 Tax=Jeotgalibacillus haloalkalitolerans TaxID=3104292 RepID=A0ABU5KIN4_9BACL|nr:iron-siderophore ABC transporter substrate-binding protein [Jeotgalibacillus sp. HH7-29]MDZ5710786.1 iron-siderophore ABC transporter substrate-binding protein [Jeotgalibacillus sp. HH7-29]